MYLEEDSARITRERNKAFDKTLTHVLVIQKLGSLSHIPLFTPKDTLGRSDFLLLPESKITVDSLIRLDPHTLSPIRETKALLRGSNILQVMAIGPCDTATHQDAEGKPAYYTQVVRTNTLRPISLTAIDLFLFSQVQERLQRYQS